MKFATFLIVAGLVLPASGAIAEPVTVTADAGGPADATSLSADELRQAVTGKTVYLDVSGFELPIHYLANGRMSGSMGTVAVQKRPLDVALPETIAKTLVLAASQEPPIAAALSDAQARSRDFARVQVKPAEAALNDTFVKARALATIQQEPIEVARSDASARPRASTAIQDNLMEAALSDVSARAQPLALIQEKLMESSPKSQLERA